VIFVDTGFFFALALPLTTTSRTASSHVQDQIRLESRLNPLDTQRRLTGPTRVGSAVTRALRHCGPVPDLGQEKP
jgi:hypothetical protein